MRLRPDPMYATKYTEGFHRQAPSELFQFEAVEVKKAHDFGVDNREVH